MAVGPVDNVLTTRCSDKEYHIEVSEAEVSPGALATCLQEALKNAPRDTEAIFVDLQSASCDVICSDAFSGVLASLALRKDVRRVKAPFADVIRGRCEGIVNAHLKEKLGDDVIIEGVRTKTRDALNANRLLREKFQGDFTSDDDRVALEVLARIDNAYNVPGAMARAITRAHCSLRKKKRVFRTDRRRAKQCSKEANEAAPTMPSTSDEHDAQPTKQARRKYVKCYICHGFYNRETTETTPYTRLCEKCTEFNLAKRNQRVALQGKYAVVTGGRVKIGFEVALKLLRDGCSVISTTRFPEDAAKRYTAEEDFEEWKDRLKIYQVDLMDLHGISKFIQYIRDSFPCLDILINNAAQTIRRPKQFFQHLVTSATRDALEPSQQNLIANEKQPVVAKRSRPDLDLALPCDANSLNEFFPTDRMDEHGQQLDLRPTNSWRSQLQDVPPSELLEVLLVNTVAPFLLTQQLRPLFLRRRESRKFIVNVSAMEGQFERVSKTKFHPHTNMAKAALNMMTRTAALGFAEDGIYMTAVDTGWVTDERPFHMARYEKQQGFQLPLDCVDGAARVYDPIVRGLQEKGTPCHAVFLKNYKPFPW